MFNNIISRDEYFSKWQSKKEQAKKIGAKLIFAGLKERGMKIMSCCDWMEWGVCNDCGKLSVVHSSQCRDRFCPICSWRLALKRYTILYDVLSTASSENPNAVFSLCTLTVENCPALYLKHTLDEMSKGWNRLLARKKWRIILQGWARSVEITYNDYANTLHPHFHIIIMWMNYDEASAYMDEFLREWMECVHLRTDFKAQNHKLINSSVLTRSDFDHNDDMVSAALEVYKYTLKSSDLEKLPANTLRGLAAGIKGKRMSSLGGMLKTINQIINGGEIDELEEESKEISCRFCGSKDLHEILCHWSGFNYQIEQA